MSGHTSPFEVFCQAQENANRPLVIDDADGLYREPTGQRLLKNLTNPRNPKTVYWGTDAPTGRGLQKSFQTTSRTGRAGSPTTRCTSSSGRTSAS